MKSFTSIDLFAGIGGIRLAFEEEGFKTVFSNEIDEFACETYKTNFGTDPCGDIRSLKTVEVPEHDVLLGGFPCQAFSIAGAKMGFEDTRGTLFFEIARIIKDRRPKAFLLENVKNLVSHDKGRTFAVIKNTLESDLHYRLFYKVLNAKNFGVPQNRERIIMVGFREDLDVYQFKFPEGSGRKKVLSDILEHNVPLRYFISKIRLEGMEKHKKKHEELGHGFGYRVLSPSSVTGAIVVGGMGRERNLVRDIESYEKLKGSEGFEKKNGQGIRYLTPREYARLQGFPDDFQIPVSNAQAYKQFANSVAVPMIESVAVEIKKILSNPEKYSRKGQHPIYEYATSQQ